MTRTLTGRVAVVTGVTSGIGRVLARDLLAAGAAVVGCARDGQRLDVVAAELPGLIAVQCDPRESADRARPWCERQSTPSCAWSASQAFRSGVRRRRGAGARSPR